MLTKDFYPGLRRHFLQDYTSEAASKIRTRYPPFPVPPKAKEMHFKDASGQHAEAGGSFTLHRRLLLCTYTQ